MATHPTNAASTIDSEVNVTEETNASLSTLVRMTIDWKDTWCALLVMYCYVAADEEHMVMLGCYYCKTTEPLKTMVTNGWLNELILFVVLVYMLV